MNVLTQQRVPVLVGMSVAVILLTLGVGLFVAQPWRHDGQRAVTAPEAAPAEPAVSTEAYVRERDQIIAGVNQQITNQALTAAGVRTARTQLLALRVPASERDHHLQLVTTLDRLAAALDAGQAPETEIAKWQRL